LFSLFLSCFLVLVLGALVGLLVSLGACPPIKSRAFKVDPPPNPLFSPGLWSSFSSGSPCLEGSTFWADPVGHRIKFLFFRVGLIPFCKYGSWRRVPNLLLRSLVLNFFLTCVFFCLGVDSETCSPFLLYPPFQLPLLFASTGSPFCKTLISCWVRCPPPHPPVHFPPISPPALRSSSPGG